MAEKLVFDTTLYSEEAVRSAAAAYADYAKLEVAASDGAVAVTIDEAAEHDLTTIARAFANHVLHETIAQRRGALLEEGSAA